MNEIFFHVVEAPIVTSLLINSVDFGPELPAHCHIIHTCCIPVH